MSSDDENGLPPPATTSAPSSQHFLIPSFKKRSRGYDSSNSSDAPCFSSDDLAEASLDNYQSPRRKKMNRGTWWDSAEEPSQLLHKKHLKRHIQRFHDSGVFMSSDSSSSEDGFTIDHLPIRGHRRQDTKIAIGKPVEQRIQASGEAKAAELVFECLEKNGEVVDLSNMAMSSLSNATLRPLRDLISIPKGEQFPDFESSYQSFAPKLQLILANNLLIRPPSEIVNLHNLTLLSLRNNALQELPHSMGKLVNLVELNVAGNRLRWLPAEILDLLSHGKLAHLRVLPNPFVKAMRTSTTTGGSVSFVSNSQVTEDYIKLLQDHIQSIREDKDERRKYEWILKIQQEFATRVKRAMLKGSGVERVLHLSTNWRQPVYLASTPMALYEIMGPIGTGTCQPESWPRTANFEVYPPADTESDITNLINLKISSASHVPSLFELAARACGQYLQAAQLSNEEDLFRTHGYDNIAHTLSETRTVIDEGGRRCSACGRSYIIARAQWIEYWHCTGESMNCAFEELYFPFLRRVCSWACARESSRHGRGQAQAQAQPQDGATS